MKPIVFGSRGSALALAQTRLMIAELQQVWPGRVFDLRIIKTQGDVLSEQEREPAREILGKGLFTGELELALLRAEIDLAVHSLKDLPTTHAEGLTVSAIPKRADARDVLITRGPETLNEMPKNAVIVTGSPRRSAQVIWSRNDLSTETIRGNIDTRLRKFRGNHVWAGMILAAAGIERLQPDRTGLTITPIPMTTMLPAPGQGALALQSRGVDAEIQDLVGPIHDRMTADTVSTERAFLQGLGGGCQQPIAAYAQRLINGEMQLDAVAWLDRGNRQQRFSGRISGAFSEGRLLGETLAQQFLKEVS